MAVHYTDCSRMRPTSVIRSIIWVAGCMSNSRAKLLRFLVSAVPLFLIAAADAFFFGVLAPDYRLPAAGYLIQAAILTIAALIIVPSKVLRLTCTILLLIVAVLASMTIGMFYAPAVGVAALLTMHQFKIDERRPQNGTLKNG